MTRAAAIVRLLEERIQRVAELVRDLRRERDALRNEVAALRERVAELEAAGRLPVEALRAGLQEVLAELEGHEIR